MVVRVEISSDVFMVCLFHALSTEKEEVMGLLIGELEEDGIATISALFMMRRSDKQEDRVEISPEQLTAASIKAESLAEETQRPLRVLGWYHSHPHITVWPSHVDVCTQANYQVMDSNFVGLIISCFNQEGKHRQKIQATFFQSGPKQSGAGFERVEVPFRIIPTLDGQISKPCLSALLQLPNILFEEENEAFEAVMKTCESSTLTQVENTAVYIQSICHILDKVCGPAASLLEEQLVRNKIQKEELLKRKLELEKQLNGVFENSV